MKDYTEVVPDAVQALGSERIRIVGDAVKALGYDRINPESLTALREHADRWGWWTTGATVGIEHQSLKRAYREIMESLRVMFGSADNQG